MRRNAEKKAKKMEREAGYKYLEQLDNAEAEARVADFWACDDEEAENTGSVEDEDEDEDYCCEIDDETHKATKNMCDIPLTALMAMKYSISNRGTSAIISGFLLDMEMVSSPEEAYKLLDHKKIYR